MAANLMTRPLRLAAVLVQLLAIVVLPLGHVHEVPKAVSVTSEAPAERGEVPQAADAGPCVICHGLARFWVATAPPATALATGEIAVAPQARANSAATSRAVLHAHPRAPPAL